MTCKELMLLKAKLLCYGVSADSETKLFMKKINHYVLEKGFVHAAHFTIGDVIINTCVEDEFCKKSPLSVKHSEDRLLLFENDQYICDISVLALPEWCNEYVDIYCIGKYVRPHSKNCISCWPYLQCDYYFNNHQCKFCSIGSYASQSKIQAVTLPVSVTKDMFNRALESNPFYEVALSGGSCHMPDWSIGYFSDICEKARLSGAKYVSVETAPPSDLNCIKHLYESGATAMIMNLEIAEEHLRKEICPGKSLISVNHYFKAYERAVSCFGVGNVSCVLLSGLQSADSIIRMAEQLISIGVIPTVIPFKPLDDCIYRNHPVSNPKELVEISTEVEAMLKKHNLAASVQHGCTKCNGCSLETIAADQ